VTQAYTVIRRGADDEANEDSALIWNWNKTFVRISGLQQAGNGIATEQKSGMKMIGSVVSSLII